MIVQYKGEVAHLRMDSGSTHQSIHLGFDTDQEKAIVYYVRTLESVL